MGILIQTATTPKYVSQCMSSPRSPTKTPSCISVPGLDVWLICLLRFRSPLLPKRPSPISFHIVPRCLLTALAIVVLILLGFLIFTLNRIFSAI
ncbi:hypothetical protein ACRRTK_012140 [Alexandromys fortis]